MTREDLQYALSKAMTLCSRSEKCVREINQKLLVWGIVNESDRDRIIAELVNNNFINETRYAENYAAEKHRINRWGRIKIRNMLNAKDIPGKIIEGALMKIPETDYVEGLRKDLMQKKRSTKAKNQFDMKGRLFRYAASRGYEYDLIYRIIDELT